MVATTIIGSGESMISHDKRSKSTSQLSALTVFVYTNSKDFTPHNCPEPASPALRSSF